MVYIEGEADNWSSDEDIDEDGNAKQTRKKAKRLALEDLVEEEGSDDEEMPLANGIAHSDSDSDEEEDDEEDLNPRHGRLVDDIAEEEDEDSDLDDEEGESLDEEDDEDSEEEEDSDMDDFIDDGPARQISDNGLLDDAEEEVEVQKPEKKRRKH